LVFRIPRIYSTDDVEENVKVIETVAPRIPEGMQDRQRDHRVTVRWTITASGAPDRDSFEVDSAASAPYAHAAIKAILASTYQAAKINGRAVATAVQQTFTFSGANTKIGIPPGYEPPAPDTVIVPHNEITPEYPGVLQAAGITGSVTAVWEVDDVGKAGDIDILSSTNAGFETPVRDAIRSYRFSLDSFDGKPAHRKVRRTFYFPETADTSGTTPARFVEEVIPEYPAVLRAAGVTGTVIAQWVVDRSGRAEPSSVRFVESSNDGFNTSVRRAILASTFRPARKDGRPIRSLVQKSFSFPF
jgi:outer membrane biosynthesis protein TonB